MVILKHQLYYNPLAVLQSTPIDIVDCVKFGFLLSINVSIAGFTRYSNNSGGGSEVA